MPDTNQLDTDNSSKVRQPSHSQFSWVAGDPGQPGTSTLVRTLDADEADDLQDLVKCTGVVHDDIERQVVLSGVTPAGS